MPFEASLSTEILRAELQIRPGSGQDGLATFDFTGAQAGLPTGLEWLGGDLEAETWQVPGPLQAGCENGVDWRAGCGLCFLSAEIPEPAGSDFALLTEQAYDRLLAAARISGHPWLLRVWNFMAGINEGRGDAERYRRFCVGRAHALERRGVIENQLCAGSAIGGTQPVLRVYALAGSSPGVAVENPRQTPAWRYPRSYGPRSPSFARATAVPAPDGTVTLLISGTASVVGHATAHTGDLDGQLHETARNLQALLDEAARALGRPGLADFGEASLLHAFVRHAADWPRVQAFIRQTWPAAHVAGLRGDICRDDLLVEIEAVHRG